ncbi:uncharacterized protein LOC124171538 isoform X2 [Ischnura elegans]|nr:uncharacterized protein LOC124171505 isoform X2 [Ischnura elegans]XP_046406673.1 uncharacterized protein LOC124171538 isoform X2 [Ischnura elegans]
MVSVVETIDSSICTELHCNILFVITCFRCCMPGQYGSLDDANFKREICQWLSQAYRIKDGRKTNEAEPEEHEGAYADLTELCFWGLVVCAMFASKCQRRCVTATGRSSAATTTSSARPSTPSSDTAATRSSTDTCPRSPHPQRSSRSINRD